MILGNKNGPRVYTGVGGKHIPMHIKLKVTDSDPIIGEDDHWKQDFHTRFIHVDQLSRRYVHPADRDRHVHGLAVAMARSFSRIGHALS